MKWAHLPEPGGLYAQNPELLERFQHIFSQQDAYDESERQKKEREIKNKSRKGR